MTAFPCSPDELREIGRMMTADGWATDLADRIEATAAAMDGTTLGVLGEVAEERSRQRGAHSFDETHDDRNPLSAWAWLLGRRASDLACPFPDLLDDPRRILVEIAAIAVAGIESIDRKVAAGFDPWQSVGTLIVTDASGEPCQALVAMVGEFDPEAFAEPLPPSGESTRWRCRVGHKFAFVSGAIPPSCPICGSSGVPVVMVGERADSSSFDVVAPQPERG